MANLDFPQNPELGQEYKGPKGKSYWWDGVKWSIKRSVIVTHSPEPEPEIVPEPTPNPVAVTPPLELNIGGIDFPNYPVVGEEFVASNGVTYLWDGVKWVINQNVIIDNGGGGTGNGSNYVLPTATNTRLGGVRIGTGIINQNGTISVDLASTKGDKGDPGDQGPKGDDGLNAYQIAVDGGFVGTIEQWLASIKGDKGDKGDTGASSQFIGTFDSATILRLAYPNPPNNYWAFVKDPDPNILHIYRPDPSGWVNEDINFPKGEKGDQGNKGDKGETGDTGATGAQGVSVTLQGTKATIADLPPAPANVNDYAGYGWIVTTGDGLTHQDGSLWFWNLNTGTWNDIGPIVGPQGDRGPRGLTGDAGTIATGQTAGIVKVGSNINVAVDGTISVPVATDTTLGVVKPGTNVTIDGNGAISVSKGAGINTVVDIPDVNSTAGGAALNDGALLIYNASSERWDTIRNLRSDEMDGGFF
jgi:hypothetical protein